MAPDMIIWVFLHKMFRYLRRNPKTPLPLHALLVVPVLLFRVKVLKSTIVNKILLLLIYNISVVTQSYTVNLWEENVLRGNSAILKCHIPSFVSEYVSISSWIISEGDNEEMDISLDSDFKLGKT